ncbi:unannotated protein [freshwater metagenome]|uniref:Unannotated protein n=1 Tax=freshwater metagenome TaxID=449393 RepID=A0A6J7M6D7_9ZZZZ
MLGALLERKWSLVALVAASLATLGLVPVARTVALRLGVMDRPKPGKMHQTPTPYLGGVAIALAVLVLPLALTGWERDTAWLLLGALLVCAVGVIDDVRSLLPAPRLAVEFLAAALAVRGGAKAPLFGNWLDVLLSMAALVLLTNSLNLLDNMDGVAASIVVAVSLPLLGSAVTNESWSQVAVLASLAGACLGFLIFNWHPAKIFMGDAGSLFLGFLLVSSALKASAVPYAQRNWATTVVGLVLAMAIAIFDTGLVVLSRIRAGRSILQGGTDHTSHRLQRLGVPIRVVALSLGVVAAITAGCGVLVLHGRLNPLIPLVPALAVGALLSVRLMCVPVYAASRGRREVV